tara:strand:+ start:695 stop:805 length:111 start_codon:yes stop_codon:yes gene_type:complete
MKKTIRIGGFKSGADLKMALRVLRALQKVRKQKEAS